mmetsp:Transcript_19350/g.44578  ORF Transcript_19350/g.44578 Transcript_19350/m.44578 type:complete len:222 (-) Transcript_19350:496-1161(-)
MGPRLVKLSSTSTLLPSSSLSWWSLMSWLSPKLEPMNTTPLSRYEMVVAQLVSPRTSSFISRTLNEASCSSTSTYRVPKCPPNRYLDPLSSILPQDRITVGPIDIVFVLFLSPLRWLIVCSPTSSAPPMGRGTGMIIVAPSSTPCCCHGPGARSLVSALISYVLKCRISLGSWYKTSMVGSLSFSTCRNWMSITVSSSRRMLKASFRCPLGSIGTTLNSPS